MAAGIYVIVNTVDGKVYVGCSNNIQIRLTRHRNNLKYNRHCNGYLQSAYNKHGAESFEYRVLEVVTDVTTLVQREQHWIDRLNTCDEASGYNLVRQAEHRTHSIKTRIKMSASHTGKKFTAEHRAKIGKASKGRVLPPATVETRAKISAAGKGRKHSTESRAKMSAAQKGRPGKPASPETRAKLSAARKGKPKSAEHRAKMSAAHTGKKLSPERREKLAELQRNRSAETCAKISEANSKFSPEQVIEIRRRVAEGEKHKQLAIEYGVHHNTISEIVRFKTWKHLR